MSSLLKAVKKTVNRLSEPARNERTPLYLKKYYSSKTRFAEIGTVGSGKTTIQGLALITAHTKSIDDPNFYCRTIENKSNIRIAASNLRRGIFPPKTNPGASSTYEAGLELTWQGVFGEKHVHIPLIDIAGEDIQFMLQEYSMDDTLELIDYSRLKDLIGYIKDSEGFLIALPAPRAFVGNNQIEAEPEDLASDPDVNLSRLLEQIISHKRHTRSKTIKFIGVIITKYDLFQNYAIKNGMDLYQEGGITRFMNTFFPDTSMQIKALRDKGLVKFYPSYVHLKYDEHGDPVKWVAPGQPYHDKPVVDTEKQKNKPKYAETSYMQLFRDLEPFAS